MTFRTGGIQAIRVGDFIRVHDNVGPVGLVEEIHHDRAVVIYCGRLVGAHSPSSFRWGPNVVRCDREGNRL